MKIEILPVDERKVRKIWRVALILGLVTLVEFIAAFTLQAGGGKTLLFILMTILKAFYIVSEFMHLGHERKTLIFSFLLPFIFIVFLIYILSFEGQAIYDVLF